jgi:hypothetical protein
VPPLPHTRDLESHGATPAGIGRRAFEAELARISRHITVGEDSSFAREAGRILARARKSVEDGNYLQAVEALGRLELTVNPPPQDGPAHPPRAGEVEQALGDVRRLLAEADLRSGHEGAVILWQAARQAVIDGRWETAMALLDEARERVSTPRKV